MASDVHETPIVSPIDCGAMPIVTLDGGTLTLLARPAGLGDRAQPSFVGRRQQHMHATASTAMRYRPAAPGDQAGITAFQNDDYYYLLTVTLANDQPVVQLEKKAWGTAEIVASAPLDLPADGTVYLKIDADADTYRFSYALNPEDWITLGDAADARRCRRVTSRGRAERSPRARRVAGRRYHHAASSPHSR